MEMIQIQWNTELSKAETTLDIASSELTPELSSQIFYFREM